MAALTSFADQLRTLARQIQHEDAAERTSRLQSLPYEAQLWLAVTPAWTFALADAVGFPSDGRGARAVAEALRAEGLCEIESDPSKDEAIRRFWMPAAARAGVLLAGTQRAAADRLDPAAVVGDIARRIVARQDALPPGAVPPLVQRWVALARHAPSMPAVVQELADRVDECLRADAADAEPRAARALDWIEAARPLGDVLGDALTAAIRQQGRRVDLVYRRRDDERQLARYLERAEPLAAFDALVHGEDDAWALHFIGAGGVGKTMLMRWLSGRWSEQSGTATARIDFDYLNPEFPSRAPALLLAQLMQDLRLYADDAADREFGSFEGKMLALHERARVAPAAAAGQRAPGFADMLETFAAAVRLLRRRVVLLLDTCEELAKARLSGGELPENVRATFEILEMLHEALPGMRVVFCGRRPLAGAGDGWSIPGNRYPARPYLSLFELRGFTREEALRYLTHSSRVPSSLVDAIMQVSEDEGETLGIEGRGTFRPSAGTRTRYSPFLLSLYSRWAQEDPALDDATIRSGDTDRYIASRVVGRIRRPALMELLPLMALVGRFDRDMLRAVSSRTAAELDEAIGELLEQDWVPLQGDGFFEVKPHLQQRLLRYLERTGRAALAGARARAIDHLVKTTLELPPERLAITHFEAAAWLIEADAPRALDWWERVETRLGREIAMPWAQRLLERLLSDEGPLAERDAARPERDHPLRASVLASYATVLMHLDQPTRLAEIWGEVGRRAPLDPRPAGAARLALRARAGTLVSSRLAGIAPVKVHVEDFTLALDAMRALGMDACGATAAVAGFESLVEMAEWEAGDGAAAWYAQLVGFASAVRELPDAPDLHSFVASLVARAARLRSDVEAMEHWWETVLSALSSPLVAMPRPRLDWRPPHDLRARLLLEYARGAWPAVSAPARVLARIGDRIVTPSGVDSDRLDAMVLLLRAASGVPAMADARPWALGTSTVGPTTATCNAHRALPPLAVAYWEAMALAHGQVDRALDALQGGIGAAESTVVLPAAHAMEVARLRIGRHMRLRDEERVADTLAQPWATIEDAADVQALLAFDARRRLGERAPLARAALDAMSADAGASEGERLHVYWRSIAATTAVGVREALAWATSMLPAPEQPPATYGDVACRLDAVEANLLAELHGMARPFPALGAAGGELPSAARWVRTWANAHPLDHERRFRLLVRLTALDQQDALRREDLAWLATRCGRRRAAAIALDEGELLALRLPAAGIRLLHHAGTRLEDEDDGFAALRANICGALAAIRCGNRGALAGALRATLRVHGKLAARGSPAGADDGPLALPSVEAVQAIARQPTIAALDGIRPLGWRPWLTREVAALAWHEDGDVRGTRSLAIREWLGQHYGAVDTSSMGLTLPPELATWAEGRAVEWSGTSASPNASASPGPDAMAMPHASAPERASGGTPRVLQVRIATHGTTPLPPKEKMRAVIGCDFEGFALLREQPFVLEGALPYFEAAHRDRTLSLRIPSIQARARSALVVELTVEHAASSGCWEGLFTEWLSHAGAGESGRATWQFLRRARESRGVRTAKPWPGLSRVRLHTRDPIFTRLLYAAWSGDGEASVDIDVGPGPGTGDDDAHDDAAPYVLHAIGTPIQTGLGDVALQVAQSAGGGTTIYHNNPPRAPGIGAVRGGGMLRMRDLRQQAGAASLVVLQANPTSGYARTSSDRECAGFLRMLASELSSLGAPAVLTVPPMPTDDSVRVIGSIASAIAHAGSSTTDMLLAATDAAREVARQSKLDLEDARAEVAADFCLYLSQHAAPA